jgi:hypothetical protein
MSTIVVFVITCLEIIKDGRFFVKRNIVSNCMMISCGVMSFPVQVNLATRRSVELYSKKEEFV